MNLKRLFGNNQEEDRYIKNILQEEDVIISPDTLREVRIPHGTA